MVVNTLSCGSCASEALRLFGVATDNGLLEYSGCGRSGVRKPNVIGRRCAAQELVPCALNVMSRALWTFARCAYSFPAITSQFAANADDVTANTTGSDSANGAWRAVLSKPLRLSNWWSHFRLVFVLLFELNLLAQNGRPKKLYANWAWMTKND